ncbi:erythromycin resistance leader peptide [Bacillus aquiflavi]|uniref:Erythromycin resistance leader peptide n=1 Tax=Bacillus aquiflavi TaxID=2672567 RepID=A0A6B3VW71_9BACI|nr:erythromycin resistance leader peptide [Bacillus aquiflavi]NEY80537.1 erythromycin resistance leader peptide [Bacillus aquiflavi]UAC50039.1 erythromycin resistance leader peptide [Bacillus aquiflavi]
MTQFMRLRFPTLNQ